MPEREHHVDVATVGAPERRLGRDAELEQEPQLDLAGDERRQLEENRARADAAVQIESCGVERLGAHLGERLDGDLHVGRVELTLGRERHDDARDVGTDGQPVGGIGLAGALERDERPAMRGAEEEVHPRLCLGEQHPMRRLEPEGGARGRAHRCRLLSGSAGLPAFRVHEGCHQPSMADRVMRPLIMQEPPCRRDTLRFPLFVSIPAGPVPPQTTRCRSASSIAATTPSVSSHLR